MDRVKYLSYLVGSRVLGVVANLGIVFVGRYSSFRSSRLSSTIAWNSLVIGGFRLIGDSMGDLIRNLSSIGDSVGDSTGDLTRDSVIIGDLLRDSLIGDFELTGDFIGGS